MAAPARPPAAPRDRGSTASGNFSGDGLLSLPSAAGRVGRRPGIEFEQRGRYREDSFGLATRFPFAFLTKTRHVSLPREVLVYPRIEPTDEVFEILPLVRGEWESFVRGRGSDLYRIREYMPEDSARHVDWKATAKSGSLKVREFAREDERKLCIAFDNPEPGNDFRTRLRKGGRSDRVSGLAFFHPGGGGVVRRSRAALGPAICTNFWAGWR